MLSTHRAVFVRLVLLAWVASLLTTGTSQYSYYSGLTQSTDEVAGQLATGAFRTLVEVVALSISTLTGSANSTMSEAQQMIIWSIYLLLWLVVVWVMRHVLSGTAVTLRDGLYNAAAPLVSTYVVILFGLIQLLPFALVVALVTAVSSLGIFSGVAGVLLGAALVGGVAAVTLYWLASTVFAAVVVTLPGAYPWASIRSARQVIAGRRGSVILRLLWLGVVTLAALIAAVVPVILLDSLTGYRIPGLVVLVSQLAGMASFIFGSAYIYLLYRGVIDERS